MYHRRAADFAGYLLSTSAGTVGHGSDGQTDGQGMAWHANGKKSDQSSRSEKRKISRCSFPLSLYTASIIHPHIIAEQFKLWPTTCNLLRRERERERGGGGSCNGRPRPSVRPPGGLRYLSSSSYFAAPQLPPPPPSNSACVYCSRSYKWHPLSPQSPRRIETDRNPNFRYLPKPNILHLQSAEYSAKTEHSAEYLIFF